MISIFANFLWGPSVHCIFRTGCVLTPIVVRITFSCWRLTIRKREIRNTNSFIFFGNCRTRGRWRTQRAWPCHSSRNQSGLLLSFIRHKSYIDVSLQKNWWWEVESNEFTFRICLLRLNLIVPVGKGEVESGRRLVGRFLRTCINENPDRGIHLILVII